MTDKVDRATQNMIKNLEQMTGKSFDEWIAIAWLKAAYDAA